MHPRRLIVILWAALAAAGCSESASRADPRDAALVARGEALYARECAACHGAQLEGQADWRKRRADGKLPAPPHDESGHTWHHPDTVLFAITKHGLVPPYAPKAYASDMPAYAGKLSDDEIWAVLAFIKSKWTSREVREARAEIERRAARR